MPPFPVPKTAKHKRLINGSGHALCVQERDTRQVDERGPEPAEVQEMWTPSAVVVV